LAEVQHADMDAAISATSGIKHAAMSAILRLPETHSSSPQNTVNDMDDTEMMKVTIPVLAVFNRVRT